MQPNTRRKITYKICEREYVYSGNYLWHAKSQHSELSEMLEPSTISKDEMNMYNQDMDIDNEDMDMDNQNMHMDNQDIDMNN